MKPPHADPGSITRVAGRSSDGKPKWRALIDRYGAEFDLGVETYDR